MLVGMADDDIKLSTYSVRPSVKFSGVLCNSLSLGQVANIIMLLLGAQIKTILLHSPSGKHSIIPLAKTKLTV